MICKWFLDELKIICLHSSIAIVSPQLNGWLFGFNGISIFVGYLMPNPIYTCILNI